jgi:inhibitor of cysteine peptidase
VETVRPADMMCTQALVPFEANIPVDIHGLLAGKYQVHINGVIASFTLDYDNILPDES